MKHRRTLISVIAIILAVMMIAPLLLGAFSMTASAVTSDQLKKELDALKEEAAEIEAKADDLQSQIDQNTSKTQTTVEQKATIDQQIDAYKNNGTPFHTYYMSVSGHCNYGWSVNDMSRKNKDVMNGEKGSETVLAYKASQQELEYALEYLFGQLDEAGIADDTVIVLTADHYPYAMTENSDADYYAEMTGINDNESLTTRYKNTLILWCGSMKEPVKIDDPCTAVDIVPTLLHLFGFDYGLRLLSGRDVLAPDADPGNVSTDMHVAIFADYGGGYSWITRAGTYEASLGTFTPAKGVTLDDQDAYIASMNELVRNRYSMAKYIVQTDYYRHVFPNWKGGMTLTEALAGSASS